MYRLVIYLICGHEHQRDVNFVKINVCNNIFFSIWQLNNAIGCMDLPVLSDLRHLDSCGQFTEAGSLNKSSCLAPALCVIKLIIVTYMILATLCCVT